VLSRFRCLLPLLLLISCDDDSDVVVDPGATGAGSQTGDASSNAPPSSTPDAAAGDDAAAAPDADPAKPPVDAPAPAPDQSPADAPAMPGAAAFFRTEVIHRIEITIDPAMWQAYMVDHTNYARRPDPVWFRADFTIDGTPLKDVGFHTFGFGSRVENKQKPNLSLDLNRNVPGQHLGGVKRMRIKNNGQDVTGLRQALVYEAMRESKLLAPRTTFADLFVNGEAWGFYTVEEHFNKDFVRERTGNDNGTAYEATDCHGFVAAPDTGCSRIMGAFDRDFNPNLGQGEDLVALCNAMNSPPEQFMSAVGALAHLPDWIGQLAIDTALAGDHDGYSTAGANFRLYRDTALGKFRLIILGPDHTFVAWMLPEPDPLRPKPNQRCTLDPMFTYRDIFLDRLIASPEGLAMYQQAVRSLRTGAMEAGKLKRRVDELWGIVGSHVMSDARRTAHMSPGERLLEIKGYIDRRWPALEQAGL
jgi:hypothetical protein